MDFIICRYKETNMNINNINNTNFQGGFRFRNIPKEAKEALPDIAKRGKQIFYDFENIGDVFLVARDNLDLRIAKFAKKHKLDCEYYPEINTNAIFRLDQPETLSNALKGKIVEGVNRVKKYRKISHDPQKVVIDPANVKPAPQKINTDFITNILNKLFISTEKIKVKDKYGAKIIEDTAGKRKIYISPADENNIHYVLVDSTSADFLRERYAMNSDGEIVKRYSSLDDIKPFNEKYNSLLKK